MLVTTVNPDAETNAEASVIPPWNVILVNDEHHSYEYVVEMLGKVFGMDKNRAYLHATEVDNAGRTVLLTTSREHAELKQQQVHAHGADPRVEGSAGSMTAEIEPA